MKKVGVMIALILVAVAALTLGKGPTMPTNPLAETRAKAIVTKPGTFSPLVRLVDPASGRTICSGTVVTQNLVLTAAHCLGGQVLVESLPNENLDVALVPVRLLMGNSRADYALLSGDFTQFSTMDTETDPEKDLLYNQSELAACGFPYGAGPVCYPVLSKAEKIVEAFRAEGQMYPAMSGGPVVDLRTGKIIAVNRAIGDGFVVFSPIIGLWEMVTGR